MTKQVKSKQRVAEHGEVFTAEREVNAMLDLVKDETERIDSRFLEPACGDGNFLTEILRRKLDVVKKRYRKSPSDFEKFSIIAITSIYGVDILADNVVECRKRLFAQWNKAYTSVCKEAANDDCRTSVAFILERNILCGNALTLKKVDENHEDMLEPIIFSEWSLTTGTMIQRRDFRLDVLMAESADQNDYQAQLSLFDDEANGAVNWETDPETGKPTPKPVAVFPLTDYRRLGKNE